MDQPDKGHPFNIRELANDNNLPDWIIKVCKHNSKIWNDILDDDTYVDNICKNNHIDEEKSYSPKLYLVKS
jgi:hypothetical protein